MAKTKLRRQSIKSKALAIFRKPAPSVRMSKAVTAYVEDEIRRQVAVALMDARESLIDLAEQKADEIRQNVTMHTSSLSGRIDRLEGVKTFPNQVVRHGAAPDEAGQRGEIELHRRQSAPGVVVESLAPPMNMKDAPLPSTLHKEARVATADDLGVANG